MVHTWNFAWNAGNCSWCLVASSIPPLRPSNSWTIRASSGLPTCSHRIVAGSSRFPITADSFLYARLKNGTYYAVAMSVRLSVRPSVRPRFPDFSSTCFAISIWNLVYTFSRWHDMSSLSCITIGSLWPSLQPKVGQTYFLQSWPHKSR